MMQALQIYEGRYHIAKVEPRSFVDGEGVRCSVYLSGCPFKCPGCYNLHAQKFTYGEICTERGIEDILSYCEADYIEGVSILGGEPFCNMKLANEIISRFRARYGRTKSIWVWSGFMFEYLANDQRRSPMLEEIDVLVDGPFVDWLYRPNLPFRGSINQRIIDVPSSLKSGRVEDYM